MKVGGGGGGDGGNKGSTHTFLVYCTGLITTATTEKTTYMDSIVINCIVIKHWKIFCIQRNPTFLPPKTVSIA